MVSPYSKCRYQGGKLRPPSSANASHSCKYAILLLLLQLAARIGSLYESRLPMNSISCLITSSSLHGPGSTSNPVKITTEICRSVEYHLLGGQKGAGGFLFPLRAAPQTFSKGSKEAVRLQKVMGNIGDGSSLEIARSLRALGRCCCRPRCCRCIETTFQCILHLIKDPSYCNRIQNSKSQQISSQESSIPPSLKILSTLDPGYPQVMNQSTYNPSYLPFPLPCDPLAFVRPLKLSLLPHLLVNIVHRRE